MSNKQKKSSFTNKIYRTCIPINIGAALVIFFYSFFICNIALSDSGNYFARIGLFTVVMVSIAEFLVAPITNAILCKKSDKILKSLSEGKSTVEDRTKAFLLVSKIPHYKQMETIVYFFSCAVILSVGYFFLLKVDIFIAIAIFIATTFGSFLASLLAFSFTRSVCAKFAKEMVKEGIDESILKANHIFGMSYTKWFVDFCIIPVIWTSVVFLATILCYYFNRDALWGNRVSKAAFGINIRHIGRLATICFIGVITTAVSVYAFLSSILVSSGELQSSMTHIIKNDIFTVELNSTDFANEVSFNIYLVNQVVLLFRNILDKIRGIGNTMVQPIEELAEISQNTAATSLEQSTGVKEILATMEDTDSQTRGIADKITGVTSITEQTSQNVEIGFATLQANLEKMNEITESNVSTISGIKELGEKIGSIWDIVNIINDIADQTRIIAFNAEIEASSAGEAGRNFHIVANEVRRLASGISNSVDQIKERITEIQHSSDNLIITSESGTEKIREGMDLSARLEEKFSDIRKSSEITVEQTLQIKEIIYQQSAAFDQIVATVRQISAGIDNFSTSTNTVNNTAIKLRTAANKLENLHNQIVNE